MILRYILVLGRCIARRTRTLACLVVILVVITLYIAITVSNNGRLQREIKPHSGMIKPATQVQNVARSRLKSLAVMGTDISSKKLQFLSTSFNYLLILPHAIEQILPSTEANFISNVDKFVLGEIIEFLDSTDDSYDASACGITKPNLSIWTQTQESCQFEKRNWTMLIRKNGKERSKTVANRRVSYFMCNIFEGAFVIRRRVFEKFDFNTDYGDTVLLDFFLRTEGKIRLALLSDCSLSDELQRPDRGALRNNPFYTDYVKFGRDHNIVRIVREHQITWTKCSYNSRLCPEKPLQQKYSLSRQLKPVCCSQVLDRLLIDVVHAMNAIRLDYRIEYGTLLGAVRSGGIIPWTRDVDIGLREDDYFNDKIFQRLKRILKHKGYTLVLIKGQKRVLPLFPPHRVLANISLSDKSIRNKLFGPNILRTIKRMLLTKTRWQDLGYLDFYIAKKERFDSLTTVDINGRSYATFANAKEVLKEWYGPGYMKRVKKSSAPMEIDIGKRRKQRNEKNEKARKKLRERRQTTERK